MKGLNIKVPFRLTTVVGCAIRTLGALSPVARAQSERIVSPEEQESYIQEFHQDADVPPEIDGVGGLTEQKVADIQDAIRQAEESGPPKDEVIPGEMWSDKVVLPATIDKATANASEVAIAKEEQRIEAQGLVGTQRQCQYFWLSPHPVCGAILDRYLQLGGALGWLLAPTSPEQLNPDGQGYRQSFSMGYIYYHPTTGAHAVNTRSAEVWTRHGRETGWLGYPLGGEVPVAGSNPIDGEMNGWVQIFQGGRIYRSPALNGFQVASINGLILDKWLELGGPKSELGFPIADEAATPDGQGRFSLFQLGSIYWHPEYGTRTISGAIGAIWLASGAQDGEYGHPTSDVYLDEYANIKQDFSKKSINLGDFFESLDTISINGKDISENLIDFVEEYIGYYWNIESMHNGEPDRSVGPLQVWDPPQNSDWNYRGQVFRVVSPFLIPQDYVYDKNHPKKGRHDFCTASQDLWGEDTGLKSTHLVADFRGPCSIHDICYDLHEDYDYRVANCDPQLRFDLARTCEVAYGLADPRRYCAATADGMYQVVKNFQGLFNS